MIRFDNRAITTIVFNSVAQLGQSLFSQSFVFIGLVLCFVLANTKLRHLYRLGMCLFLLINCCWLLINLKYWSKNANGFEQYFHHWHERETQWKQIVINETQKENGIQANAQTANCSELFVCPSHAGIVSKRLNILSCFFRPFILVLCVSRSLWNSNGVTPCRAAKQSWVRKNRNNLLYLRNGWR